MIMYGAHGARWEMEDQPFKAGGEGGIHRITGQDHLVAKLYKEGALSPIRQEKVCLPEQITASSQAEVDCVRAAVLYSDGSQALKAVGWNTDGVDFSKPGVYAARGLIRRQTFPFPLAKGYGDPVIFPWEGKWYFLGTNDNLNDIGTISDGPAGRNLYRYRVSYVGNALIINNGV